MEAGRGRPSGRRYAVGVVAAFALGVGVGWNVTNVSAVADPMAAHYGVPLATVALLTSIMFFAELVLSLPVGWLVDRVGPRTIGIVSLAAIAVGNTGLAFSDDFAVALALRCLVGAGAGAGFLVGAAYIERLGGTALTQGVYGSLSLAASGAALATVPALENLIGWQAAYVSAIAVAAGSCPLLLVGPAIEPRPATATLATRRLLTDSRILRFGAVQSAAFGLCVVISAWVVTILERRGGIDAETAGLLGAVILFIGIVGRPVGGLVVRHAPDRARPFFAGGMLLGAVGTLLLAAAQPVAVVAVGAVCVGVAAGLPFGATMAGLAHAFPGQVGTAFGAVNTYVITTVIVATPLVGLTFSLPGDGAIGFAGIAVLWLLVAAVVPGRDAYPSSGNERPVEV